MTDARPLHTTVTIHDGERRAEWLAIFGTDTLPVKSPIPTRVNLPGIPNALVYEIDLAAISADQRQRLVAHTAAKFDCSPDYVDANLERLGMPVLAQDVTVTSTKMGLFL